MPTHIQPIALLRHQPFRSDLIRFTDSDKPLE